MSITLAEVGSFVISIIPQIVIGVAAAWVTARFALNRFYREKWWERKQVAYNQLIDTLIEMQSIYGFAFYYYEAIADPSSGNPVGSIDWDRAHELKAQLRRFYVLAPISLSDSTRILLDDFFEKDAAIERSVFEENYPAFLGYSDIEGEIKKLIESIVDDAKDELNFK